MVVCLLFPYPVPLEPLAEACYRFTPRMAVRSTTWDEGFAKANPANSQDEGFAKANPANSQDEGFAKANPANSQSRLHEALFLHFQVTPQGANSAVEPLSPLLMLKLQHLCGRFGLKDHQVGWGTAAPLALARARYRNHVAGQKSARNAARNSGQRAVATLPLEALVDLVSPFSADPDLTRRMNQMSLLLHKLGLQNLGDFAKLPLAGLASRFGEEALTAYKVLNEGFEPPWPPLVLPEKVVEEEDLESRELFVPVETLEPLLFLLRALVDRVVARLHGRNERAVSVQLDFESHRSALGSALQIHKREWEFGFPVPQKSFNTIFPILKEKLFFDLQRRPLEAPVTLMRLSILETAPGSARQRDFFHNREHEQEVWSSLVARLCQKLGEEHVFGAEVLSRHRPESAWRGHLSEPARGDPQERGDPQAPDGPRTGPDMRAGSGARAVARAGLGAGPAAEAGTVTPVNFALAGLPNRPTRLLSKPRLLDQDGDWLSDFELRKRWKVIDWDGPERISGEWWSEHKFERDYYRVLTDNGEQLWLFLAKEGVYLHGFFD